MAAHTRFGDSIAQDFAATFQYLAQGKALYHPHSSSELTPGSIGYFDWEGKWNHIGNIADAASLANAALTPLPTLPKGLSDDFRRWEYPLQGGNISRTVFQTQGKVEGHGVPVGASVRYDYLSNDAFGAILVTSPRVTVKRLGLFPAQARAFVRQNASVFWGKAHNNVISEDCRRFGLCIVKDTWNVDKYMLTAWRGKGQGASVGFGARATGLASALTSAEWFRGNSAGQWHSNDNEIDSTPRVVFVSGVRFHPPRFWESTPQPEPLRSHDQGPLAGRDRYTLNKNRVHEGTDNDEAVETEGAEQEVAEVQWETFGNFDSQALEPKQAAEASDEEDDVA